MFILIFCTQSHRLQLLKFEFCQIKLG